MSAIRTVRVDWDLDEILDILGHLNRKNLLWFLSPLFPNETLDNWKEEELLELGLSAIQQWEKKCVDGGQFLVSVAQSLCRNSLEAFVRFMWDEVPGSQPLLWNWHLNLYCDELQYIANYITAYRPRPHDLICNVPPGTSKSTVWSVLFPTWIWTRMPKAAFITSSHTDSLVTDLASKSRDVMNGGRYKALFPEIQFSESLDSKGHYRNTLGGERFTCTVAGKSPTGKHAHFCLSWNTPIWTELGEIPIGKIVDERLDVRVLAYDHREGCLVWKKIISYGKTPGRPISRVHFNDGSYVEATAGHPIYVVGRGYVPLEELELGDEVLYVGDLHALQKRVRETNISSPTEYEKKRYDILLLSVLSSLSCGSESSQSGQIKGRTSLPKLWEDNGSSWKSEEEQKVLQLGMQEGGVCYQNQSTTGGEDLSDLWEALFSIPQEEIENELLFQRVCSQRARVTSQGKEQSKLYSREWVWDVSRGVSGHSTENKEQGRMLLSAVWSEGRESQEEGFAYPSHRLGQEQQYDGEFSNLMSTVSFRTTGSNSKEDGLCQKTVVSIEHGVWLPNAVYNLQVEDTNNYFADSILFHNSICDDPIDPKKVLSEAERKTAADFITKVMPSRRMRGAQGDVSVSALVMQRLGIEDPTDVMLNVAKQRGAWPVRHICLPAELTDDVSPPELREHYLRFNTDAGKNPEGLLDPIRYSQTTLDEQRAILGEWAYAGQFLQKPRPMAGGMFKIQWFSRRCAAAPFNSKRIRYWDRACLVAGTKVETSVGPKAIEAVREGDLVLTRKGYKRVIWAGESKRVKELCRLDTPDGFTLIATPDHRVWCHNKNEWVPISELTEVDTLVKLRELWGIGSIQRHKRSSLIMSGTSKRRMEEDIIGQIYGIKRRRNIIPSPSIEPFGNFTMGRSQKVSKFITRMKIRKTTTSQIWSVCQERNTDDDIRVKRCGDLLSKWKKLWRVGGNGTKRAGHQRKRTRIDSTNVRFVENLISTNWENLGHQSIAVTNVGIDQRQKEEGRREFVLDAGGNSFGQGLTSTIVRTNVEIPVYDLEVEEAHEFFANGILVHNSSKEVSACATAGVLMAYDGEKIYIEDVVYGRWEPDERNAVMLATAQRDRTKYGRYEPTIYIEAEGGSSGRDAWLGIVRTLIGFPVREDRVQGSKDTRAEPWATQLAAGNVWLIDNGASTNTGRASWDIEGFIEDHLHFRPTPGSKLGREKDRIDAASGSFNLLVGVKRAFPALRTLALRYKPGQDTRYIVVCKKGELPLLAIDNKPSLILSIADPLVPDPCLVVESSEVSTSSTPSSPLSSTPNPIIPVGDEPQESQEDVYQSSLLSHQLPKNLGEMKVCFADLDPKDYVGPKYDKPILPWNLPIQDLQLSRELGKQLWTFLFHKYDVPWGVLVLVDDNLERALSVAYGVADGLRLPRSVIHIFGEDGVVCTKEDEPPNEWVHAQVKLSKCCVVEN